MDHYNYSLSALHCLWAKKSRDGSMNWLPLLVHLEDTALIAERLWDDWVSDGIKNSINRFIGDNALVKRLFVFMAAAHDIGKATPVFQAKVSRNADLDERIADNLRLAGLTNVNFKEFTDASMTPHALASQILLENSGCDRSVTAVIGAHHGKPQKSNYKKLGVNVYEKNFWLDDSNGEQWIAAQDGAIAHALNIAGFDKPEDIPAIDLASQVLLSGLLIMADWMASNEYLFPFIDIDSHYINDMRGRADEAWRAMDLPRPWKRPALPIASVIKKRFDYDPNKIQSRFIETVNKISRPGIICLEAPMGRGKTEAALAAAELLAEKTGRTGVFFALPTQATSDGMFLRFAKWIANVGADTNENYTVRLAHGKAGMNKDYRALMTGAANIGDDDDNAPFVHEWFEGSKKTLLADFVVGTIDQLLLAALKHKFVMLRHLGLANKVVVIDEVHAYDAYMGKYLELALRWLGAYRVPVVMLSATLPSGIRRSLIEAYLGKKKKAAELADDYPIITYTDGETVFQERIPADGEPRPVTIKNITEDEITSVLKQLLSDGGCAGVIVNTVKRAQRYAAVLRDDFGTENVRLFHSRFLAPDRSEKENKLMDDLGKPRENQKRPEMCVVVGTQVLEQSLDIDFDVLITDVCPMDLLLQRIGRLQRHDRSRKQNFNEPHCYVIGLDDEEPDAGSAFVYKKYILMKTKALLPKSIVIPDDISPLVQRAYGPDTDDIANLPGYADAKKEWDFFKKEQMRSAETFQICLPWPDEIMIDWLNTDVSEKCGEASVRDSDESIEVLAVQVRDGKYYFLPWVENFGGVEIPTYRAPEHDAALALASQTLRLPAELCVPWRIMDTIKELDDICKNNFNIITTSPYLMGASILPFDSDGRAELNGHILTYSREDGLTCVKKEDGSDADDRDRI